MKVIRLCLVVCFILSAASCSLKTNWDLVGKWENLDGKETIEFLRNGTLNLSGDTFSLATTYRFTDPKHLQISVGSLGTFSMKVAVSNGTLTLTDSKGQTSKYKKAK